MPLDLVVRFDVRAKAVTRVRVRNLEFACDPVANQVTLLRDGRKVSSAPVQPDGALSARILIDRGVVEAFWNGGEAAYTAASLPADDVRRSRSRGREASRKSLFSRW